MLKTHRKVKMMMIHSPIVLFCNYFFSTKIFNWNLKRDYKYIIKKRRQKNINYEKTNENKLLHLQKHMPYTLKKISIRNKWFMWIIVKWTHKWSILVILVIRCHVSVFYSWWYQNIIFLSDGNLNLNGDTHICKFFTTITKSPG